MGLAEPRKRIKIAHDPRNLQWTNQSDSYGQRLMQQQGWKSGEALGAKGRGTNFADTDASKVNVKYKDDTLGLGATLKSKDIEGQRTGFDAFQGLLGRLNAKTEEEVQVVEKKLEDKKLAMFAQGRWGGMTFVPGGLLVQSDPYKQVEALKKVMEAARAFKTQAGGGETDHPRIEAPASAHDKKATEKAERKAERRRRKEERRLRKEAKKSRKEARQRNKEDEIGLPTPDSSSTNEVEAAPKPEKQKDNAKKAKSSKKRQRSLEDPKVPKSELQEPEPELDTKAAVTLVAQQQPKPTPNNRRQFLRGKNIQAKRMVFSDMKGLDEIFMRKS